MGIFMADAIVAVRQRLDELIGATWLDPELRRWLLESAREVARTARALEKTGTIAITAGTRAYASPSGLSDMLVDGIKTAYFTPTGQTQLFPLEYREIRSLDQIWIENQAIDRDIPSVFTIWGVVPAHSVILYPVPSVSGTMTVYYHRLPADPWAPTYAASSDATTAIDIPNGWEDLLYAGCEYKALRRDRDPRWSDAFEEFSGKINQLADNAASHSREPQLITPYSMPTPPWMMGQGRRW